ncbi:uncharacterized protein LOC111048000 [Nilaparvata lugens]|uniref:uncharacterized protein LOC111048000 n=1 Tax=Nilaparvata lugens TaxID=108931 RepID=UPI000B98C7E4|nr:uncharacterized protein LOC111048000 [Nilaparvata lugens]
MVETPTPSLVRLRVVQKQVLFERRVLFACTVLVGLSLLTWLVAISTDYWFYVEGGHHGIYVNETKRYFLSSNSGLWRICRNALGNSTATKAVTEVVNNTGGYVETQEILNVSSSTGLKLAKFRRCRMHEAFPSEQHIKNNPMLDKYILHYTRTEMMFSLISLMVMIMGFLFSIYTFRNPRYTFKRLAGAIHLISCLSIMVVIEVLMSSIDYERQNLRVVHPPGATHSYGFSYYLACIVFAVNLVAGISFFWYSKKRKGNKAPNDELAMADEPTIMGR